MKLTLERRYFADTYTIGDLFIDDVKFCETIEDKVRDSEKVYGQTAIPYGTYKVDMNTVSPKFKDRTWAKPWKGKLPRLLNVPNFDGVLIHVGNTADDSLGCILVGRNLNKGRVEQSATTFNALMERLTKTTDEITIQIVR